MSVSMWSYRPEVCDGGGCPGDCDLCDKPKNMEDEPSDYISRQVVVEFLDSNNMPWRDWVNDIPSADVVEVVRCHECKYYRDKSYCFIDGRETIEGNDYCSWGERAEA